MKNFFFILLILALIFLGISLFSQKEQSPELTEDVALALLEESLPYACYDEDSEGIYQSCSITLTPTGNDIMVAVTYDGLYDDSVRALRVEAPVAYNDGGWALAGNPVETYQCREGRGQQDFAPEFCL